MSGRPFAPHATLCKTRETLQATAMNHSLSFGAQEKVTDSEVCPLILSLVTAVAILVDIATNVSSDISQALQESDFLVRMLLLVDLAIRPKKAANKAEFMRLGRIDLTASIPSVMNPNPHDVIIFAALRRLQLKTPY